MDLSYVALERLTEMEVAQNPTLHRLAAKAQRPSRARGRKMGDAELIAKLGEFGVRIDRVWLDEQSRTHASAQGIAEVLLAGRLDGGQEEDWTWVCLAVLWERWFPDRPNREMLDDKMQEGYARDEARDEAGAAQVWLAAWRDVLALADRLNLHSIEAFDEWFGGTECLSNWVQDVPMALWNAGLDDRGFWRERIAFCQSFLDRFRTDCELTVQNMRRGMAETHGALGDTDRADALFREWLEADPQWGWGWIGWATCYSRPALGCEAPEAAERILRQGLAVGGVRDRGYLMERLEDLCQDSDATPDAGEVSHSVEVSPSGNAAKLKTTVTFGGQGSPLDQLPRVLAGLRKTQDGIIGSVTVDANVAPPRSAQRARKTGRNDPCPCGSGRKYKKCCGRA